MISTISQLQHLWLLPILGQGSLCSFMDYSDRQEPRNKPFVKAESTETM